MARSGDLSRPIVADGQRGFSGGLNLQADPAWLGPNEVRRADNARLTQFGGITRRGGTRNLHASALGAPSAIHGLFCWEKAASTQWLAVANGTLSTTTYSSIPVTWSAAAGSLSTSATVRCAAYRDGSNEVVYLADGGLLNKWDGATLTTDIASTPSTAVVAVYNERLFGISGTSETLYWSQLGNGDSLGIAASLGGSANIRSFGNQKLTGLLALGSSLLLFHVNGISRFTGVSIDDIAIQSGTQGVSQDVGTIAPGSIVAVENVGYVATSRGVFQVTEGGVQDVSVKVSSVFTSLASTDLANVSAAHHKALREVWFHVPTKGIYVYNYRLGAWSGPFVDGYLSPTSFLLASGLDPTGLPIVCRGTSTGFVQQCEYPSLFLDNQTSANAGGTAYTMTVQCHRLFTAGDQQDPATEKSLRWGWLTSDLQGGTMAGISWTIGSQTGNTTVAGPAGSYWDSGTLWDSGSTWGASAVDSRRFPMWGRGRWADVTFTDSQQTDAVYSALEVDGFNMSRR